MASLLNIPLTRSNERVAAWRANKPYPIKSYDKVELFQIDLDQRHDGEIWLRKIDALVSLPKGGPVSVSGPDAPTTMLWLPRSK
jgi:hypothetical protein